jgi:hypothetical protein
MRTFNLAFIISRRRLPVTSFGRCVQSLLIATLVVGCVGSDPVSPRRLDTSPLPDGTLVAESAPVGVSGADWLVGVSPALESPAFVVNASPSTSSSALATDLKAAILTIFADPIVEHSGKLGSQF